MSEEDEPPPGSKGLIKVFGFLGIISLGTGVYHGFYDAQGINYDKNNLAFWLQYGPAITQGMVGAAIGGLFGLVYGAEEISQKLDDKDEKYESKIFGGAVLGSLMTAVFTGASGVSLGYLETLVGYGIGYAAGFVLK